MLVSVLALSTHTTGTLHSNLLICRLMRLNDRNRRLLRLLDRVIKTFLHSFVEEIR